MALLCRYCPFGGDSLEDGGKYARRLEKYERRLKKYARRLEKGCQ